ncbi:MAG: Ig-like domain-containing protein, partial [Candidatus Aenigmarchaeota archaeon]|nr:Ig-like domain-containing protein [Candidatus Aenigmarchaeota archaeon]
MNSRFGIALVLLFPILLAPAAAGQCANDCSYSGQKICDSAGLGVYTCGQYDSDSCLDWGSWQRCQSGWTCPYRATGCVAASGSSGANQPPSVTLSLSKTYASIGDRISVTARASDDKGLRSVTIYKDGSDSGTRICSGLSCTVSYEFPITSSSGHTFSARVTDASGLSSASASASVRTGSPGYGGSQTCKSNNQQCISTSDCCQGYTCRILQKGGTYLGYACQPSLTAPPSSVKCSDSGDNGDDKFQQGTARGVDTNGIIYSKTDYCVGASAVYEFYCGGVNKAYRLEGKRDCPTGYTCSDGACISSGGGTGKCEYAGSIPTYDNNGNR